MKTKRYWLRGGIIGFIVGIICLLLTYFPIPILTDCVVVFFSPIQFVFYTLLKATFCPANPMCYEAEFSNIILPILIPLQSVIIGAIVSKFFGFLNQKSQ